MQQIVLGIGDMGATNQEGASIKTFSLGSCVAVIMIDPVSKAVGMAHVALPESQLDPEKAKTQPGRFADTAVKALIQQMRRINPGCRLIVKLAGGAQVMDPNSFFNIGKKNLLAIKKALWANQMGAIAEDVGGVIGRTVSVEVNTGRVLVSNVTQGQWEL